MKVLVCGGRNFSDQALLERTLNDLRKREVIDAVIEGNASGADRMAGFWARKRGIDNLKFPAEWRRYGHAAGPIRNLRMLSEGRPDLVLAFPGGKGTADMIQQAKNAGVEVICVSS